MQTAEIIYSYTRKEALEDGAQVCLSTICPEECKLYRFPVYCTAAVWKLIESAVANPAHYNDLKGVVWDLMFMSTKAPVRKMLNDATCEFIVIVQGADRKSDYRQEGMSHYRLISQVGATDIDNPATYITLMFPEEL